MSTSIAAAQTLYIRGLPDKVKKEELRRSLFELFSQYSTVLDVVALKTSKMRGQAFVVMQDAASARAANKDLQNLPFYGRPMRIFAAEKASFEVDPAQRRIRDAKRDQQEQSSGLVAKRKRMEV